jgi:hypothetical protein
MQSMSNARLQCSMVVVTMVGFVFMLILNEWLLARFDFMPGISWVYLPAGMRLLSTLLFAEAGAVGLLLVSWLVCFFYFFPDDYIRSFMGGILATLAPYLAYRIARHCYGLQASLQNLTPKRLLMCVVGYSFASPLLHHLWFAMSGRQGDLLHSFAVMAVGDLSGSLIVIYTMKLLLSLASKILPPAARV